MKKNLLLLTILQTYFVTFLFAQTGPGGIGNTNGTSSLVLWLDANKVTGTTGSTITTWNDQSGNGYNFNLGNGAVFNNPSQNGYPAFNFNGSTHYFERAFTPALSPSTFSIFSASNVTSNGNYKAIFSNRNEPPQEGFMLYALPTTNEWSYWTGSGAGGWDIIGGTTSTAGNWAGQDIEYANIPNGKKLYLNQTLDAAGTQTLSSNTINPFRVGAGRNETAADYFFEGDIGEVIMFNTVVNEVQQIIINNYLSAKYNYTLSAHDLYIQDNVTNGNYDHEVAGIGSIDATIIHNDAQGTSLLRINNPNNLNDDEFLIWGHDNGIATATNTADIPVGVAARFERVWRVNEVDKSSATVDVGAIDLSWDLSSYGSITASDLRLLVDDNNNGIFSDDAPISGAISLGGGIFQFPGVTAIANNLRFTLGTINLVTLPIDLISFSANAFEKNKVQLTWQTATEINNAYFTIQKSIDGNMWEDIAKVNGAGNSSQIKNYSFVDNTPYNGITYYRLTQVNFDGNFKISATKFVNLNKFSDGSINAYPNPTYENIIIETAILNLKSLKIYNELGQDVTGLVKIISSNNSRITLNVSKLTNGNYHLKVDDKNIKISKL